MLGNDRASYKDNEGTIHFGSSSSSEAKSFRHQILFSNEDDIHFPTLSVAQTLHFALRNKAPEDRPEHLKSRRDFVTNTSADILDSLGIGHTKNTLVGNEFVRGVSGGERKRVSIAEVLAGQV
jgi:ATP-binding cassette subfamily G (WHITE) protein 2 (SNQ2)